MESVGVFKNVNKKIERVTYTGVARIKNKYGVVEVICNPSRLNHRDAKKDALHALNLLKALEKDGAE